MVSVSLNTSIAGIQSSRKFDYGRGKLTNPIELRLRSSNWIICRRFFIEAS